MEGTAIATLLNIAIREASRAPMILHEARDVGLVTGLEGDFRGRTRSRQVTVLSREAWAGACAELGTELPWTTRRANLLVEGLDLEGTAGQRLHVGTVVLEITGETRPCDRMDEAHEGLRAALTPGWRGGITCRVVTPGRVQAGDAVRLVPG